MVVRVEQALYLAFHLQKKPTYICKCNLPIKVTFLSRLFPSDWPFCRPLLPNGTTKWLHEWGLQQYCKRSFESSLETIFLEKMPLFKLTLQRKKRRKWFDNDEWKISVLLKMSKRFDSAQLPQSCHGRLLLWFKQFTWFCNLVQYVFPVMVK